MEETFSRDAFEKDEKEDWRCIKAVSIKGPRGLLQIPIGTTFTKGIPYLGLVDIAERLDEESS